MKTAFCAWVLVLLCQLQLGSTVDDDDDDASWDDYADAVEEGELDLVKVGMYAILAKKKQGVTSYLEGHRNYTAKFGNVAYSAYYMATTFLDENFDVVDDTFKRVLRSFGGWIMDAKKSGLITFDEVPLVFVERGADTDTDDLRVMHGMQERRSAAVPEDSRPERHTLANLFAKHLFDLAKKRATLDDDDLVRKADLFNALFRLTFRRPSEMQFKHEERVLVADYIRDSAAHVRRRLEEGIFPPQVAQDLIDDLYEINERMLAWGKRQRNHEEL